MRRTEAALSPGVPGGQAVALDMLILQVKPAHNRIEKKTIPTFICLVLCIDIN